MDEITRYREQRSESACQLCDHEVEFGQTEHGYRGFVHLATGTTECPREECGACGQTFPTLAEVFSHPCEAIEASRRPHLPHETRRGDSVDAPDRHEGSGSSSHRPSNERTNRYPGTCVRCGHRVAAEAGLLVKDNSSQGAGTTWGVEHRRGDCPAEPAPEAPKPQHRPNKYAGACTTCRGDVAEGAGRIEKRDGSWLVFHLDGGCQAVAPAAPRAEQPDVPAGHYAIESTGHNDLAFYRVDRPTEGTYAGRTFVKLVVGGHPDQNVPRSHVTGILARISQDPEAAARYGQELGRCYNCNRTLTDETSRELGIGPECRKHAA